MSIILIILVCLFYILDIRCTFEGKCPNWGWAKTLVFHLLLLSGSITSLSFLLNKNKHEDFDINTISNYFNKFSNHNDKFISQG
jgi:hypothetical protein